MSDATITYQATQDDDAWSDDPRAWSGEPKLTAKYLTNRNSRHDDFSDMVPELVAFWHAYDYTGNADLALRAANHYAGVYGTGRTVSTMTIRGYSQGDWWDVVTVDTGDAETFAQWLRGDVWTVRAYRETVCELGEAHREIVAALGSIYADDDDAAIAYFRSDYAEIEAA